MKNRLAYLALCGALFSVMVAPTSSWAASEAGTASDRMKARFEQADQDRDGFLSLAEAEKTMPRLAARFARLDSNQDGKLSLDELEAARERMREQGKAARMAVKERFAQADLDHDGYLTQTEAEQGMPRLAARFTALDGNADGKLSMAELGTARTRRCGTGDESRGDKMKTRFEQADQDHDGFLSQAEAEKGMPRVASHFATLDSNRDGKLSLAELQAARERMRGR